METLLRALLLSALAACAGGAKSVPPPQADPVEPGGPAAPTEPTVAPEAAPPAPDLRANPPALDGFAVDGEPTAYDASTLFDYVNGAADGYLKYGFEELVAIEYANAGADKKGSLTVDIYRHADAYNGYGVYRQEQFSGGHTVKIGAQATHKPGVVLFFKGPYYVKISGYELGGDDQATLMGAAKSVADSLPGSVSMPRPIDIFPASGLVAGSVRYVNQSFLGHSFLRRAFYADYELDGKQARTFIIEAADEPDAQKMLASYAALARSKGLEVRDAGGTHSFLDPYRKADGPVNARTRGGYVLGLFATDPALAKAHLDRIEARLHELQLIR